MFPQHSMALKEWATVVWALGEGVQIVLLRKGGVADQQGAFRLSAQEFFLYPTYEHQQEHLLQPQFVERFRAIAAQVPLAGEVQFRYYAVVTDVLPAPALQQIRQWRESFIWNDAFLENRYRYRPELPLHALLLRTYRLPQPVQAPEHPHYLGCRSWVELDESLSTRGAEPVLADQEYEPWRRTLREQLAGPC